MSSELGDLGRLIKQVQWGHHRALDSGLGAHDLTLVQWNALREIDRNPGKPQLALAECTFNSPQAFGTLMTRLIERGWVKRSDGEGRATIHALTAKGRELLAIGQDVMDAVLTQSFEPLNRSERTELERLLRKMLRDK